MSTIGVTHHNEDIHNIIKDPTPPIIKSPMYKSAKRKPDRVPETGMAKGYKSGHQTFGLAHYEAPDARNFLKKKTGNKPLVTIDLYPQCVTGKPMAKPQQVDNRVVASGGKMGTQVLDPKEIASAFSTSYI